MADSALLKAAKQGNTEEVKRLIAQNADVNVVDEDARTALYLACTKDNTEVCYEQVCRLLIQKGAEVKCQNIKGETPLHLTCTDDRKKNLVELLLDSGADVTIEDKKGRTPLHVACENGCTELVKQLVQRGADCRTVTKRSGCAAAVACQKGQLQVVEQLIQLGLDVRQSGMNLLSASVRYKNVTELLLQRGADVNEKNSSNGNSALHSAVCGPPEVSELLLKHGADVNATDKEEETPLSKASYSGRKDLVELFIKHGADIKTQNTKGLTPLHFACSRGRKEICETLIKLGADVNAKDKRGYTPLHSACKDGRKDISELLIQNGADVNLDRVSGDTPLHCACEKGSRELADLLLTHGADVNRRSGSKIHTPLHVAIETGTQDLVVCLLQHNADVTLKDKNGVTPLDLAKLKGLTDILSLLEKHNTGKAAAAAKTTDPAKSVKKPQRKDTRQRAEIVSENKTPQMKAVEDKMLQRQQAKKKDGKGVSRQEEVKVSEAAPTEGHVMISYQWTYQKTVLKIRDELKKRNFRVWLDVDHMTGNIMDAMAAAVDGATAVLMCVSSSYKDSKNCRAEIEYAYTQQKPIVPLLMEADYKPTGWLGIMLGNKLYFDFSGKYPFKAKMEELVRELERQGLRT
nr:hypothetical protein BaRGS_014278 [Batillaria attramentaria]